MQRLSLTHLIRAQVHHPAKRRLTVTYFVAVRPKQKLVMSRLMKLPDRSRPKAQSEVCWAVLQLVPCLGAAMPEQEPR